MLPGCFLFSDENKNIVTSNELYYVYIGQLYNYLKFFSKIIFCLCLYELQRTIYYYVYSLFLFASAKNKGYMFLYQNIT